MELSASREDRRPAMFKEEVQMKKSGLPVQVPKRPNISRKIKVYFILTQLLTSLDFGYAKYSKQKRLCVKLISLFQTAVVASVCITSNFITNPPLVAAWRSVYVTQYIVLVIILSTSNNEKSFCNFQRDLLAVDAKLGVVSSSHNIEIKMMITSLICVFLRVATAVTYFTVFRMSCSLSLFVIVICALPLCAVDSVLIVFFFLFYSVYCRLRKLTQSLGECYDVVSAHYLYKSIIDSTETIKNTLNPMFLTILLYIVPCMLVTIYQHLVELKKILANPSIYYTTYVSLLLSIVLLFSTAAMADTLASHTDYMVHVLQDKLLYERGIGKKHVRDIKRLIRYIEARPFKFTVCRIIPLNLSLPVIILNLCITYLIVIIQFMY